MSAPAATSVASTAAVGRVLRRLFLTLFLRGRSSRGLRKEEAPKSIGSKLALTLVFYALFGLFGLAFMRQPIFSFAVYLHAMTFVFLGMFVAASAGEVLFNKEEADILLHRPVPPRALLWSKISVLVQVSLWIAGAFNLAGFFAGVASRQGGWLFLPAHALSTTLEALFCTGCVVMVYQLCLRWFGRERLEGLMTTAQVLIAVAAVLSGQLLPQLILRFDGQIGTAMKSWWIGLLPPAWFAGFDDALAGSGAAHSWVLAALGLAATAAVLWIAFGKLARDYETGLQMLGETVSAPRRQRASRRWFQRLVQTPPLRWWLRDSVGRATFLLTAAYLLRDRDVKLRIYPGLAPMLIMPIIFLIQDQSRSGTAAGFGVAFTGGYLGIIPMLALDLLRYSQQWHASDIFHTAPLAGPAPLCHGARRAVLSLLTLPLLILFALIAWLARNESARLLLLLPGVIALPIYALIPCLGGKAVPLSVPMEDAKSAVRAVRMIGVMVASGILSGLTMWSWSGGWFWQLVLIETFLASCLYAVMRKRLDRIRWSSLE
jgi:ABC-2 type transport system permease protein